VRLFRTTLAAKGYLHFYSSEYLKITRVSDVLHNWSLMFALNDIRSNPELSHLENLRGADYYCTVLHGGCSAGYRTADLQEKSRPGGHWRRKDGVNGDRILSSGFPVSVPCPIEGRLAATGHDSLRQEESPLSARSGFAIEYLGHGVGAVWRASSGRNPARTPHKSPGLRSNHGNELCSKNSDETVTSVLPFGNVRECARGKPLQSRLAES
jgi:hypothetical protein